MNEEILQEISTYPKDWIDSLLQDQHSVMEMYIQEKCLSCKLHSEILYKNRTFHICNDTWSGMAGRHVMYSETMDLCIEMKGYQKR